MGKVIVQFFLATLLSTISFAETPIEIQPVKVLKSTGTLGTCSYAPSSTEKPFFDKLTGEEQATGSFMEDYDIHKKNK